MSLLHGGKLHSANNTTQESKVVYIIILINNFLRNKISRNRVNGHAIECFPVKTGLPQGSILNAMLVLASINDQLDQLVFNLKLVSTIF